MNVQEVGEAVKGVAGDMQKVLGWQAKHDGQAAGRQLQVDELRETVFGNGRKGLKSDVQRISDHCAARSKATSGWRTLWFGVGRVLIAAAIIGVVSWMLTTWRLQAQASPPKDTNTTERRSP